MKSKSILIALCLSVFSCGVEEEQDRPLLEIVKECPNIGLDGEWEGVVWCSSLYGNIKVSIQENHSCQAFTMTAFSGIRTREWSFEATRLGEEKDAEGYEVFLSTAYDRPVLSFSWFEDEGDPRECSFLVERI